MERPLSAPEQARVFAALGDRTRLSLLSKLCGGQARSITQLTWDFALTRQAITKHLRVLQDAGLVHCRRSGRESRFEFSPEPLTQAKKYLELVSEQWDASLRRLKAFVER